MVDTAPITELRSHSRDVLARVCPPSAVRRAWEDDTGRDPEMWRALAQAGLTGVLVPEVFGGLDLDDAHMAAVLEEAGRVALPLPLLETAAVVAPLLAECGDEPLRDRWLPGIASGSVVATVQFDGQRLVADAHVADVIIVIRGGEAHLVSPEDCRVTEQPAFDGARRLFDVTAPSSAGSLLTRDTAVIARAFNRAATGVAALLVGTGTYLLSSTVDYVKLREQFGRPVGSFQAVQHKLADAHLLLDTARPAVLYAAAAIAAKEPAAAVAASVAKVYAAQAEARANAEALQCHGGIGFSWDYDLHLWLKRGKALEFRYGSPQWHRARIAEHLLGAPAVRSGWPL